MPKDVTASIYQEAGREGSRVIAGKSGKSETQVLEEALAQNEDLHNRADTTGISEDNVEESRSNIRRAFEQLLGR